MSRPDCPHCFGTGRVDILVSKGPPVQQLCTCVLAEAVLKNVERGMKGLSNAAKVKDSPLLKLKKDSAWVTGPTAWFRAQLRHVAVRQGPSWGFKVVSDADLMSAWLATVALQGYEILDADAREDASQTSLAALTLVDLILPPELLIIRLGVKSARNQAMPEVLAEALQQRSHVGKPTWVWDQPDMPLAAGHLCYSTTVQEIVSEFAKLNHKDVKVSYTSKGSKAPVESGPMSIRDSMLGTK